MANCEVCEKDMLEAEGCTPHAYIMGDDSKLIPQLVEYHQVHENGRCVDCGAKEGNFHHIGCDQETCMECGGQYIGCDCDYTDHIMILKEVKR